MFSLKLGIGTFSNFDGIDKANFALYAQKLMRINDYNWPATSRDVAGTETHFGSFPGR